MNISKQPENISKNRYRDIMPCKCTPHTHKQVPGSGCLFPRLLQHVFDTNPSVMPHDLMFQMIQPELFSKIAHMVTTLMLVL
jgi:hypothetical protein